MVGIPSELSEPALAGAMDLALRRLVQSDLSDREWILFEGRLDGIRYMVVCMSDGAIGCHASIAHMNEQRPMDWLVRQPNRNDIVLEIRRSERLVRAA